MSLDAFSKIDDYLDGKLNDADLIAFESAMKSDKALENEVNVYKLEKKATQLLVENDLRQKMKDWKAQREANKEKIKTSPIKPAFKLWWILGYAILGLFVALFAWLNFNKTVKTESPSIDNKVEKVEKVEEFEKVEIKQDSPKSILPIKPRPDIVGTRLRTNPKVNINEATENSDLAYVNLANSFYQSPDFSEAFRSVDEKIADTLKTLLEFWQKKDYSGVVQLVQTMGKSNNQNMLPQALLAHAQFNLKNFEEAESIFSNLSSKDLGQISEDANWYRALCLLALQKIAPAKEILQTIANVKNNPKSEEAEKLLERLKN